MKALVRRATRRLGIEIRRYQAQYPSGCARLLPQGTPRGNVLIAYIVEPFLRAAGGVVSTQHTHHWESVLMAQVWRDLGYAVDVIDYRNVEFLPHKRYDYFVSARTHLELLASRLNPDCVKIAHLDTSHFAFNNQASYERLRDVQHRRGIAVWESMRLMEANRAIECADFGVVLGNDTTADTYRYAGTPLSLLDVPSAISLPFDHGKDYARVSRSFLWFGSGGMIHKGLDLTLEAFTGMPEMRLTVCGPVSSESGFDRLYSKELHETANVRTVGWTDVNGPAFREIAAGCIGLIYPSCAEGQAGAVVTCLRAGLIPIVSRNSGIDVAGFGITLEDCTVESIQRAVRQLAAIPAAEAARRAKLAWDCAVQRHSHDAYVTRYTEIIRKIVDATAG
jgi:hypothetical protein